MDEYYNYHEDEYDDYYEDEGHNNYFTQHKAIFRLETNTFRAKTVTENLLFPFVYYISYTLKMII